MSNWGRCAYSNHRIVLSTKSTFAASLERRNCNITYRKANTCLIASRFNTSVTLGDEPGRQTGQWSKEKFMQFKTLHRQSVDLDELASLVDQVRRLPVISTHPKIRIEEYLQTEEKTCFLCSQCKPNSEFLSGSKRYPSFICLLCKTTKKYFVFRLRRRFEGCLLEALLEQGGRCYRSRLPLSLTPKSNWFARWARKDLSQPWTAANAVLICAEFESPLWTPLGECQRVLDPCSTLNWDI